MLRRRAREATAVYDEALEPVGLRITQFSVLHALYRRGPLSITELALEVALDRSTMGRNLAPLERQGMVQLEFGKDDRRQRKAILTSRGEDAVRTALPRWRSVQRKFMELIDYDAMSDVLAQIGALHGC